MERCDDVVAMFKCMLDTTLTDHLHLTLLQRCVSVRCDRNVVTVLC